MKDKKKHFLVTGGTGFIGSAICKLLLEKAPEYNCAKQPQALHSFGPWCSHIHVHFVLNRY